MTAFFRASGLINRWQITGSTPGSGSSLGGFSSVFFFTRPQLCCCITSALPCWSLPALRSVFSPSVHLLTSDPATSTYLHHWCGDVWPWDLELHTALTWQPHRNPSSFPYSCSQRQSLRPSATVLCPEGVLFWRGGLLQFLQDWDQQCQWVWGRVRLIWVDLIPADASDTVVALYTSQGSFHPCRLIIQSLEAEHQPVYQELITHRTWHHN